MALRNICKTVAALGAAVGIFEAGRYHSGSKDTTTSISNAPGVTIYRYEGFNTTFRMEERNDTDTTTTTSVVPLVSSNVNVTVPSIKGDEGREIQDSSSTTIKMVNINIFIFFPPPAMSLRILCF